MKQKKRKRLLLPVLLAVLAVGVSVPLVHSLSEKQLLSESPDAIYSKMKKVSAEKLIKTINGLEERLPEMADKTELIPFYRALSEKAGEFSESQLIDLIKNKDTLAGIESVFVYMYAQNGFDRNKLGALLDLPEIAEETKTQIVLSCVFTADELRGFFEKYDGQIAVTAMQKLISLDRGSALQFAEETVHPGQGGSISDEKSSAVCLAVAAYFEEHRTAADLEQMRQKYFPLLREIYQKCSSEAAKDQAVYAMARICDSGLFQELIESPDIDRILKVTVIERNIGLMRQQIAEAGSEEDIRAVIEAMELHPVKSVGTALQEAVDSGRLPKSEKLTALIADISKNGVDLVDKYNQAK